MLELGLDLELVEAAAQESRIDEEPYDVELSRRRQRDRRASGRQVVGERAVGAFSSRFQVALDLLSAVGQRLDLTPQLLGLCETERGVLDIDRETSDPGVGARPSQGAVEIHEAGAASASEKRYLRRRCVVGERRGQAEAQHHVAARGRAGTAADENRRSGDENRHGDESENDEEQFLHDHFQGESSRRPECGTRIAYELGRVRESMGRFLYLSPPTARQINFWIALPQSATPAPVLAGAPTQTPQSRNLPPYFFRSLSITIGVARAKRLRP